MIFYFEEKAKTSQLFILFSNSQSKFEYHLNQNSPPNFVLIGTHMSERSEIESLYRSLNQIASNLNEYLSKSNAPTLEGKESVRVKKTPEMTYMSFLVKVLSDRPPVEVTVKKQSYNLQEDLELLIELSSYASITSKSFE